MSLLLVFVYIITHNAVSKQTVDTIKLEISKEVKKCSDKKVLVGRCMDGYFTKLVKQYPTKLIMQLLVEQSKTDPLVLFNDHPLAHSVGRATFVKYGSIKDAFNNCTIDVSTGCLHGAVERALFNEEELLKMDTQDKHYTIELLKKKLPTICSPESYKHANNPYLGRSECGHGVGHAILFSTIYDYRESLNLCKLVGDEFDVRNCYGGVAMENLTGFDSSLLDLKMDDHHYPCNTLTDSDQLAMCYSMQPSIMFDKQQLPWDKVAYECVHNTVKGYAKDCAAGIGRQMAAYVHNGDSKLAIDTCLQTRDYYGDCVKGVVRTSLLSTLTKTESYSFCELLNPDWNKWCKSETDKYYMDTIGRK
jgi:hypothetical protein